MSTIAVKMYCCDIDVWSQRKIMRKLNLGSRLPDLTNLAVARYCVKGTNRSVTVNLDFI